MFDLKAITAANVGSAVRWVLTAISGMGMVQSATVGLDWPGVISAAVALSTLGWAFWSNKKKVA